MGRKRLKDNSKIIIIASSYIKLFCITFTHGITQGRPKSTLSRQRRI